MIFWVSSGGCRLVYAGNHSIFLLVLVNSGHAAYLSTMHLWCLLGMYQTDCCSATLEFKDILQYTSYYKSYSHYSYLCYNADPTTLSIAWLAS